MTDSLSILPQPVRECVESCDRYCGNFPSWQTIRADLLRVYAENAESEFRLRDLELLARANADHATERLRRAERAEAELERVRAQLKDAEELIDTLRYPAPDLW